MRNNSRVIQMGMRALSTSFFALALLCGTTARSAIIGQVGDNGNGTFTYSYTIDNTSGTFDIFAFSLEFQLNPALIDWNQYDIFSGGDVVVPDASWIAGPGIPTIGGASAQDMISLSTIVPVPVGTTLSGFSFISGYAPGTGTYTIEYGENGESQIGTTIGPVAGVPETSQSLGLMILGLLGIFCFQTALRSQINTVRSPS